MKRKPLGEFRMALLTALVFWRGVSITEGAFYYMQKAREEGWGKDD